MKNLILEVEHHGSKNRALIGFDNVAQADKVLTGKGFKRMFGELLWCGIDIDCNEVSVMEPVLAPAGALLAVFQTEEAAKQHATAKVQNGK